MFALVQQEQGEYILKQLVGDMIVTEAKRPQPELEAWMQCHCREQATRQEDQKAKLHAGAV